MRFRGHDLDFSSVPSRAEHLRFFVVAIPLIIAPDWGLQFAAERFEPYEHVGWAWLLLCSLPVTVVLSVVVGGVAWVALRGSTVRPLSTLCIVFAMPVMAYRTIAYVNVACDPHPAVVATVQCIRYIHRVKGLNLVEVTSWHEPGATVQLTSLPIRESECVDKHAVRIAVHPGLLHAEWISPGS